MHNKFRPVPHRTVTVRGKFSERFVKIFCFPVDRMCKLLYNKDTNLQNDLKEEKI